MDHLINVHLAVSDWQLASGYCFNPNCIISKNFILHSHLLRIEGFIFLITITYFETERPVASCQLPVAFFKTLPISSSLVRGWRPMKQRHLQHLLVR